MDLIQKFLRKLDRKRHKIVLAVFEKLKKGDFSNLDIKKLKGDSNVYRVRKGRIRIIFRLNDEGDAVLMSTDFRDDNTY